MKKLRVLALMHPDLVPPADAASLSPEERFRYKTEYDVASTLQQLGHEVRALGVQDELHPIRDAVDEFKPDIAFNLLEEFQGNVLFDQNVVSLLELLRVPYTGCNPRGLIISREKALSKKLLVYHRIRVPAFHAFPMGLKVKRPRELAFPLIVKSLTEHASLGISKASIVHDDAELDGAREVRAPPREDRRDRRAVHRGPRGLRRGARERATDGVAGAGTGDRERAQRSSRPSRPRRSSTTWSTRSGTGSNRSRRLTCFRLSSLPCRTSASASTGFSD